MGKECLSCNVPLILQKINYIFPIFLAPEAFNGGPVSPLLRNPYLFSRRYP